MSNTNPKYPFGLYELRKSIFEASGPDLLEDAVGGYENKTVAFIGCNPHSSKSKFNDWVNGNRKDALEIKMRLADKVPALKYLAFKNLPHPTRPDDLLKVDDTFPAIQNTEFLEYLSFLARPIKKQYHYNIGKYFLTMLKLSDIPHCDVYKAISLKSIFLEIFKFGTPTEKDIPNSMLPSLNPLTRQLDWLLHNGLRHMVFVGNRAQKYRKIIMKCFSNIDEDQVSEVPSFSPMPAAARKWINSDSTLKENLAKIWAI